MTKNFSVPRGTSDILPDQILLWENLESIARKMLASYGYRQIRTPLYEETALFKRSLGQASDIVNKQLLELVTSKEEGYCLRPEGTAAVVRSYLENSMDARESLSKLFYMGPMFRGERPQKGRLRQFHQIGAEAIGPNAVSAFLDAEMMALAMNLLKALGVKTPRLKINSLGSKEDKAHISNWLKAELDKQISQLCPECQNRFERNVFRVLDCKNESCRKIVVSLVKDLPLSSSSQDYFQKTQQALRDVGIDFEVSAHLVRGLDYYTHTVFEITSDGLGSQDAVGAGGRYSGLIHELGGNEKIEYGAIGFALGIERVLLAANHELIPAKGVDAYVIAMDEAYQPQAFSIVQNIRSAGISADMSYAGGSLKSQMNKANKANARFVLILGEQEMKDKNVTIKNMQTSAQELVSWDRIIERLK